MEKNQPWMQGGSVDYHKAGSYNSMARNLPHRKLVLHNEGVDRNGDGNPMDLARYVVAQGIEYHLIWNAQSGKFVQIVPFDKAAKSLLNGNIDGGIGCNRSGTVCIQVCVQGYGHKPFTNGPMKGANRILDIAKSWDIPIKKIGGGNPASFNSPNRGVDQWHSNGFAGHSHAPHNNHSDPGQINWDEFEKAMKEPKGN